jgi:glycolate oxidase iron-sulfur subunit
MADNNTMPHLAACEDILARCFRCGLCRTVCPSFEEIGLESASPRGRLQFARAVLSGEATLDDAVERRMLDCLTCMRCADTCPAGVETHLVVLAARAELVDRGRLHPLKKAAFKTVLRSPRLMGIATKLGAAGQALAYRPSHILQTLIPRIAGMEDKHFPNLALSSSMDRWPVRVPAAGGASRMRVGYFIGCATNLLYPEVADATIAVLSRHGIEVVIPRGQACCGIPAYSAGDFVTTRALAERNREVFAGVEVDCIVTDCASCAAALKHDVAALTGIEPVPGTVYDLNEFLIEKLDLEAPAGAAAVRTTYHDPCHLSRGQGIRRQPREILRLAGTDLVELAEPERCCGGAGAFAFTHHDLARKVGARKTADIRATGAECVATPCPACRMQIEDLLAHEGLDIAVRHPVELLAAAYGIKPRKEPRPAVFPVAQDTE